MKESFKWRNRNLLEKENNNPLELTFKNIFKSNVYYIIFAIIISLFVKNLFKDEKISTFLITLFSILICFIVPALTLIFDKFLGKILKIKKIELVIKMSLLELKILVESLFLFY
ncbi:hypothetical protein J4N46_07395 [Capnocytophaga sp. Marseille-Q4570]|uniref:Uncharacterized protein n=1 Tax=Capnocytophaga bilenii TaxID=2819369 RepID=A0ABS3PY39_9FLAO|nr:hypothetical protein [Capnocytophaga bilenii]